MKGKSIPRSKAYDQTPRVMNINRYCIIPSISIIAADAIDSAHFPMEGQVVTKESEDDEDEQDEDDSGEVEAARRCRQPRTPSAQERREHKATHIPYRY